MFDCGSGPFGCCDPRIDYPCWGGCGAYSRYPCGPQGPNDYPYLYFTLPSKFLSLY